MYAKHIQTFTDPESLGGPAVAIHQRPHLVQPFRPLMSPLGSSSHLMSGYEPCLVSPPSGIIPFISGSKTSSYYPLTKWDDPPSNI